MSFPSLLLALGNPKVNYFSLDIEGAELQVLRSLPWKLVNIEVNNMKLAKRVSSRFPYLSLNSRPSLLRFHTLGRYFRVTGLR